MAKKQTKSQRKVDAAFREVNENVPAAVRRTQRKKGKAAAQSQLRAIALSKARRSGARVPRKKSA